MKWTVGACLAGAAALLTLAGGTPLRGVTAQAAPSVKIMSPAAGARITDNDIKVATQISNYKLECSDVGLPDKPGQGHIHAMIDGMDMAVLTNFYCDQNFTISGSGLKPGKHQLIAILASDTHADVGEPNTIDIDYEPAQARPLPASAPSAGKPSVKVTAPADKASVGPKFNLGIQSQNFNASCDLEGKGNVVGYGHYHVFVDLDMAGMMAGMASGMMSMAGMISMPCANTVPVDLSAWANGTHTITVELVNNDHTSIEGPDPAMITVNLQGSSGTGRGAAPAQTEAPTQSAPRALPVAGTGGYLGNRSGTERIAMALAGGAAILAGLAGAWFYLSHRLHS